MYIETWLRIFCPHCDKPNWVCEGNVEDLTGMDPDGFTCWKCHNAVPLHDDYPFDPDEVDTGDEGYEDGLRFPPKE